MDGYGRLYAAMRGAGREDSPGGPVWVRLGAVLEAEPLRVDVGGTAQEAGRFYIAARLLDGYAETASIQGEAAGKLDIAAACAYGSHDGLSVLGGTLTMQAAAVTRQGPGLQPGDLVLLLTDDDQTFYLLDKVVRL